MYGLELELEKISLKIILLDGRFSRAAQQRQAGSDILSTFAL